MELLQLADKFTQTGEVKPLQKHWTTLATQHALDAAVQSLRQQYGLLCAAVQIRTMLTSACKDFVRLYDCLLPNGVTALCVILYGL